MTFALTTKSESNFNAFFLLFIMYCIVEICELLTRCCERPWLALLPDWFCVAMAVNYSPLVMASCHGRGNWHPLLPSWRDRLDVGRCDELCELIFTLFSPKYRSRWRRTFSLFFREWVLMHPGALLGEQPLHPRPTSKKNYWKHRHVASRNITTSWQRNEGVLQLTLYVRT